MVEEIPQVTIIILNWNSKQILFDCLSALRKTEYPRYKVIVVDNGSTDGSGELVSMNFPEAEILPLSKNYGFSKGNNIGIKYAIEKYNPDYFLLLNNDTEVADRDWLRNMLMVAENDTKTGIVGCKLVFPDGKIQSIGTPIARTLPSTCFEVEGIIGAVFLIKRDVVEKIGLLDEGYSPFYAEDIDYCARARMAGYKVKVIPEVQVIHRTNQTIMREPPLYTKCIFMKGELRFRLLNYSFFSLVKYMLYELYTFFAMFFEIRCKNKPPSLLNLKFSENYKDGLRCFCYAFLINLKNLHEIIQKRLNRTKKLWY